MVRVCQAYEHDLSKTILLGSLEGGRLRGRQRKCWINVKEWTALHMPELLTMVFRKKKKKDWERIPAETFVRSLNDPVGHRTQPNWTLAQHRISSDYLSAWNNDSSVKTHHQHLLINYYLCIFFRHHKCDHICQSLHDDTTYQVLPVHATFRITEYSFVQLYSCTIARPMEIH